MTSEEFIKREKDKHPDFDYSETIYTGSLNNITVRCKRCNQLLKIKAKNFSRAKEPCPCSNSHHIQYSQEEWKKEANKIHEGKYDYSLVEYKNAKLKVKIICKKCNSVFEQLADNHLRGHGCPFCKTEKISDKLRKEIKDTETAYILEYTNARTKAKLLCKIHNKVFFQRIPDLIKRGPTCEECSRKSKGEEEISLYLKKKKIEFKREEKFADLKDKDYLAYDFYIPSRNLLIEFNGKQHYNYIPFFHKSPHEFHRQLHHDWLKRRYAKKNGITLLVIPFWEFKKIDEILEEKLT